MKKVLFLLIIITTSCKNNQDEVNLKLKQVAESHYTSILHEEDKGNKIDSFIVLKIDTLTAHDCAEMKIKNLEMLLHFESKELENLKELVRASKNMYEIVHSDQMSMEYEKSVKDFKEKVEIFTNDVDMRDTLISKLKNTDSTAFLYYHVKALVKYTTPNNIQKTIDEAHVIVTKDYKVIELEDIIKIN